MPTLGRKGARLQDRCTVQAMAFAALKYRTVTCSLQALGMFCVVVVSSCALQRERYFPSFFHRESKNDHTRYTPFYTWGFMGLQESAFFLHLHGDCTFNVWNFETKPSVQELWCEKANIQISHVLWDCPAYLVLELRKELGDRFEHFQSLDSFAKSSFVLYR